MFDLAYVLEDEEGEKNEEEQQIYMPEGPGIPRLIKVTEENVTESKFVVTKRQLEALLAMFPRKLCTQCHKPVQRSLKITGCTVICKWV